MPIVEFDESGAINHIVDAYRPEYVKFLQENGRNFLEIEQSVAISHEHHYVRDGEIIFRPAMRLTVSAPTIILGGDPAVIEGLPDPCLLHIPDEIGDVETHEITGGRLEVSPDNAGRYVLTFEAFPYLLKTIEITVVTPLDGAGKEPDMWGENNAD